MIDFDKMTVAEHEQYKEMQRKAEAYDEYHQYIKNYKFDENAVDDDITLCELVDIHDKYESGDSE